jgi:UDP-N-acetylglucosamine 2-epimerase (non-hydrolysing)
MKPHLLFFLGTRPEAIKLGPVIRAARESRRFKITVCFSGQHKHMALPMLQHFGVEPTLELEVPRDVGNLPHLIGTIATRLGTIFQQVRPDMLIVQGDTTSAMVGATCAFSERLPVAHVEAGLRSWDFQHPFPEEFNRRVISLGAALHLCPTKVSAANLVKEGVSRRQIRIVGNSCIDALFWTLRQAAPPPCFDEGKMGILVTGHRRENWEEGIANLCAALKRIVAAHPQADILFPVHLNPKVQTVVRRILGDARRVRLTEPLDYRTFCWAMKQAKLIITDSGGVQEEALALGTPTLVTRKVTERPEVLDGGTVQLVGSNTTRIASIAHRLLGDEEMYARLNRPRFPFGRGDASVKIVQALVQHFAASAKES